MNRKTKLIIENIYVPYSEGMSAADVDMSALAAAEKKLKKTFGIKGDDLAIYRKSIDARKRNAIRFVFSVCAEAEVSPDKVKSRAADGFKLCENSSFEHTVGQRQLDGRPVIVGFGPAGIFCAMALAENGYRPIVYERGADVEERVAAVERFVSSGVLDTDCNIQFGAGGAGTFSDGKLTTRINDPLCSYVLEKLVSLGAPEDILYKAKPHIGTDVLRQVVAEADRRIRSLGGDIIYNSKVTLDGETALVNGETVPYGVLVLALGHSARDTYAELLSAGYMIEAKPFSAGVRIEHLQSELDVAMYGDFAGDERLGHAEYNVSLRDGQRGVYSFCMCPGGQVVGAASEEGGVVTNGMSNRQRNGRNANAALAVSVLPGDFGGTPAGAIEFQRNLERAAYKAAGCDYSAPMQTVGDFLDGTSAREASRIMPTYMNGTVTPLDLHLVLPPFITDMLEKGIRYFGGRIRGFDGKDVPLTGVETRTSAPVRIIRNEKYTAIGKGNIYPCGEGAGYAGGIMSAAIDGLKVARAVMEEYSPE